LAGNKSGLLLTALDKEGGKEEFALLDTGDDAERRIGALSRGRREGYMGPQDTTRMIGEGGGSEAALWAAQGEKGKIPVQLLDFRRKYERTES